MSLRVENAYKSYGQKVILGGVSIHLKRGEIYGLLGPSGCGKTTFLSCIVGRKKLDSGEILILNEKPDEVHKSRLGYMPQEIALVSEFTIKDAIMYFGRLANVPIETIEERFQELQELLELPPSDRYLKECSGGQQRRVSFAVSLIHKPEFLILDEPTVGLDPLLRERLWQYLVNISKQDKTTVIITTHYIEEARQCDKIGMLRSGQMLCHESPDRLLQLFQKDSLEEIFFILSMKQQKQFLEDVEVSNLSDPNSIYDSAISLMQTATTSDSQKELIEPEESGGKKNDIFNFRRFNAQIDKNFKQLTRNWQGLMIFILMPATQIFFSLSAIGTDPKGLKVGVINKESYYCNASSSKLLSKDDCHFDGLGCRFLSKIQGPMMVLQNYDTLEEGFEALRRGKLKAVISMSGNFTESLERRVNSAEVELDDVIFGQVQVWIDPTDRIIHDSLKSKLILFYDKFIKSVLKDCNLPEHLLMNVRNTTFYSLDEKAYATAMAPGFILCIAFGFGVLLTAMIITDERLGGMWERSLIAGVTSLEMTISHLLVENIVVLMFCSEILMVVFFIIKINLTGSYLTTFFLTFIHGSAGMILGLNVSILCNNYSMVNMMGNGIMFIISFSSGLFWPLEGMPIWLRYFTSCLPITIAMDSLKNVMIKGWSLTNPLVINGVGITLVWMVILCITSVLLLRRKM